MLFFMINKELVHHSKKLVLAFRIIALVKILQIIRTLGDYYTAMKTMSVITQWKIILKCNQISLLQRWNIHMSRLLDSSIVCIASWVVISLLDTTKNEIRQTYHIRRNQMLENDMLILTNKIQV